MQSFPLEVGGAKLRALFSPPRGKPLLVFCHGFPGRNFNEPLARELASRGFGTLLFRYRGAHGSEGTYSFRGNEEDVRAAVAAARPHAPKGLGLLGFSMGGLHAVRTLAHDPTLAQFLVLQATVADVSGLRALAEGISPGAWETFLRSGGDVLQADADVLVAEALAMRPEEEPVHLAPRITVPTLLLHGTKDAEVPLEQSKTLQPRLGGPTELVTFDTDHQFFGEARRMGDAVERFLRKHRFLDLSR